MIRVDVVNMTCVNTICDDCPMETMGDRLRRAREKAGFSSAMAAAKRFGWPTSTYGAHENGQNGFPVDAAERYGRAFKVSAGWLLSGDGEPTRKNVVRIEGLVGAGGAIETSAENDSAGDELDEIEVPFPLPDNAAAYQVSGDSMFPRYDDGDVIIVLKRPQSPGELLNFESLVTTLDGNRYLKRIVGGARKGSFDLESFNAPPMRNVKIQNATEIHSVVRRGQWRRLDAAGKRRLINTRLRSS
ncbi:XRE family transcriptional regulator [Bradyrhizobium cosmicum]|uniref:XRE family transcriptional regulator n=1 Tax=Bradyrhizobium cosmicum TaxID=1404864 RepID=UPI00116491AB|nr:S24 family peptidase [Bradyrhizobium cosmicum]QDP20643.1 helix-turn-helix transcriptional regulator [Bradyrhizobium cosmicum]QDP20694.1 helix-turn-helix transcriptional regulator [Bradyrhizobium cosmicum]